METKDVIKFTVHAGDIGLELEATKRLPELVWSKGEPQWGRNDAPPHVSFKIVGAPHSAAHLVNFEVCDPDVLMFLSDVALRLDSKAYHNRYHNQPMKSITSEERDRRFEVVIRELIE